MERLPDRLPLVIGVTGHRDLRDRDVPRLEQEVAAIIAQLRQDYLAGGDTPIIVLSALAEGADRLVARVALKQDAQLIAPLPMPICEYRRDFDAERNPDTSLEFEELLAQAIASPVMPLHDASLETLRTDQARRNEQYRALGAFIAQRCHVLLALWDGDDNAMSPGGTAEVVKFKREGIRLIVGRSPQVSLDASRIGPVIEVITPRAEQPGRVDQVSLQPWGRSISARPRGVIQRAWRGASTFLHHLLGQGADDGTAGLSAAARRDRLAWEQFDALIKLTNMFNRDAALLIRTADGQRRLQQSLDGLFTAADSGQVDSHARSRLIEEAPFCCRLYAIADALAIERRWQFTWDWKLVIGLGFVAFLCFETFERVAYIWNALFLIAYLLMVGAGVLVYAIARRRQDQERYLDYRAFAEVLRIALYWSLLSIGPRCFEHTSRADDLVCANAVGVLADLYPVNDAGEIAWVKVCLRTLEWLVPPALGEPDRIAPEAHAMARRLWVQGQFAYYKRQGHRYNSLAESIGAWSNLLLLSPTLLLMPVLMFLIVRRSEVAWFGYDAQLLILVVLALMASAAAVLMGYSERLALKEQARQYDRMRMLFGRACDLLPPKLDDKTMTLAQALYCELGMEAMKENAEWVSIYRQRPIRSPH